jgi:hypothetical protein
MPPSPLIERGYLIFPRPDVSNELVLARFRELMDNLAKLKSERVAERATIRRPLVDLADLVIDRDAESFRRRGEWSADED